MSTTYPTTFPAAGPVTADIKNRSGDVTVTATEATEVVVDLRPSRPGDEAALEVIERATVAHREGDLRIVIPESPGRRFGDEAGVDVVVSLPARSVVRAENGSGDITSTGELADVDLSAGSGDVSVERAAAVKVRTGSGDITIQNADSASVKSGSGDTRVGVVATGLDAELASGDLQVDQLGTDARLSTASGDVTIGTLDGRLQAKTASGDVTVARALGGDLQAKTVSGDIAVAVVAGTAVRLDCSSVTGRVTSELDDAAPPADTDRKLLLAAQSISGSVSVTRTT